MTDPIIRNQMFMSRSTILFVISFLIHATGYAQPKKATVSPDLNQVFGPLKWRSIGPFRGGRSVAACGVPGDITTYYMGTTGGGLWKTDDMGTTWRNVSDGFFKTGSVGAVAVAESDRNVVYVGMGEHAPRGVMTHHGDGVYKSVDAGKSWKRVGLELTQHISRVIIHPADPNTVYVAAQGSLYGKSDQRGIFKTTDGGVSWKKVLYVDDKTGPAEISMDMTNPRILYAAMWEHGRQPWKVISGGPGSGLYKSVDGGESWQQLKDGLPTEMGKMAISVCRSNPEKVYALIESDSEKEAGGLFLSEDAGKSWSQVTNDHRLVQRAWYYIELFTDPKNEDLLYVLSAPALKSTDGGRTWTDLDTRHGDHHDLWINPKDPKNMILADDGGAVISVNGGKTWSVQSNMPTSQLYRINVDNQFPYRIYAGQQDNSSLSIAHREFGSSGITPASWSASAGGESAFLAFNPDSPFHVLGGSYQGTIEVLDTRANASTNIMAAPIQYLGKDARDMKYRFNWNAPIIWSKHEPNTYYHGSQLLLRTRDLGRTWTEASPDLTRNEKDKQGRPGVPYTNEAVGAENYGTLSYVIESPHEKGVLWTGSDDGLVHLTMDGGSTWKNVTPAGLSECLINAIEVSPHDKGTAYIATTRYKFNDHTPGLFKTTDHGRTWTKINNGIPANAFTRVVREDEQRKDLLFAGTELGLYISYNGGADWAPFQLNLPITPITDLRVHKGDLIAATSGRSFWILDDLGLLRQFGKATDSFFIYKPKDAYIANGSSELNGSDRAFTGSNPYRGVNPANGIVVYYQLPAMRDDQHLRMEIRDASGNLIRSLSSKRDSLFRSYDGGPDPEPRLSRGRGLNRFVWNMRHASVPGVPGVYMENSYSGHKASPGRYTITLSMVDGRSMATMADILPNPLYRVTDADQAAYNAFMSRMEADVTLMHNMLNALYLKQKQLAELLGSIPADNKYADLRLQGTKLLADMKAWDEEMVQRKSTAYDDVENFPNRFTANYMFMMNQTESDLPRVNKPSIELKKEMDAEWAKLKGMGEAFQDLRIPAFNKALWDAGIGGIWKN
jgi:photosystem II stability/assembly factor-like uncharacterized protein